MAAVILSACVVDVRATLTGDSQTQIAKLSIRDRSGPCGTNVSYFFSAETFTLTVTGNGSMVSYASFSVCPWEEVASFIQHVSIELGVTSIGGHAFENCTGLTDVHLSESVEVIGFRAFAECTSLVRVNLPSSVRTIESNAFCNCSSLETVVIPSNVTIIGNRAFYNCSSLKAVVFNGTIDPKGGLERFGHCDTLELVCVPMDYVNDAFCGMSEFCKSDSCDELSNQINHCFGCNDKCLIHKREDAIAWENQSNGCLHYSCDNISGFIVRSKCEKNRMCMDNNTCSDHDRYNDYEWRVAVDIDAEKTTLLNMTEVRTELNLVSGIDIDNLTVAVEINDEGKVQQIVVFLSDKDTAEMLTRSINTLDKGDDCDHGILCQSTKARAVENKDESFDLSEGEMMGFVDKFLFHLSFLFFLHISS